MWPKRKPDAWLHGTWPLPLSPTVSVGRWSRTDVPLYRESPTAKEERAIVRAAVKLSALTLYVHGKSFDELRAVVDRYLAKRKKAKR